jgi:molecular chaperone DnaK
VRAALVVGCGTFDDPEIATLEYAGRDAIRMMSVMRGVFGVEGENIHLLVDKGRYEYPELNNDETFGNSSLPTRSAFFRALIRGKRNLQGRRVDVLFIYFSGHGCRSPDDQQDYLVLKDTFIGALHDTAIRFSDLIKHVSGWSSIHTVIFIDACRANIEMNKSITEKPQIDVAGLCPPGMITFCSCNPGERSYESNECRSGLFTEALSESIGTEGRRSTVYEINEYLVNRLPKLGLKYNRPIQHPYTKVEPLDAQNLVLVREEIINSWRGNARLGVKFDQLLLLL